MSHPPAPAGPASVTLTHDGANLTIDWAEVAAASGYHLDLREAAAGSWTRQSSDLTDTTATVAAPNPNAGYQARVQAVNSGGASAWTESAEVFPSNLPPAAPYWVKLRRTSYDHVTATWHAIPNAAGYEVQYMERRGDWQLWAENVTDATDELHLDAGKSYMVRVRAKNANGNSQWQTSDALNSPTLATGGIYVNVVNLNIFNYYGSWYYQADVGPHSTCTGPAPNIHPTISGLAAGTTYTYTAYDHATCDGDPLTPPVTFTTLSPVQWLSFSNVASTTATLNIHDKYPYDKWWYARIGVPNSFNCVEVSGSSANLTGLTAKTLYDYAAYTTPFCYKAHILDRTRFSTTDAGVGNLTSEVDGACAFGKPVGATLQSCAVAFTTGTNDAGGWFLDAVTVRLGYEIGWTNGLSVALHSADANGKPAVQALAAITATPPKWGDEYTFSCSGSGACDLADNTTYFIVLSAPKALYSYYRQWQTRNSALEYRWPPAGGWAIGNGGMVKTGGGDWTALSSGQTPVLHIAASETSAGLRAYQITANSASLHLSGHTPAWYFQSNTGPHSATCTSQPANSNRRTADGLSPGTYYIYTAYSDSGCTLPIASVAFTTVATALSASNVRDDAATLTLAGHSGNWHYQANRAPHTSCATAQTGSSVNLTGLSPITSYAYSAYSDGNCANLIATAAAFTTRATATLSVSSKKATTATLTVGSYSGQWWYDADKSPYTGCHSAGSASSVDLDHLTADTEYTFTAYDASGCNSADEIASETFTTLALSSSSVTATGATLTISNYSGSWYYKATSGPDTSCSSEQTGTTKALTGLTPGTQYTYSAYSDSTCTDANKLATASAFTTGGVSVSNLGQTGVQTCHVGSHESITERYKCAIGFTTGNASNGYTLHSVIPRFLGDSGDPGDLAIALHTESGNNPAANAISNAVLSGDSTPATTGSYTYTCSGTGCSLLASTTYFVVMSAPNAPVNANNGYLVRVTSSTNETKIPSNNGWLIADKALTATPGWSQSAYTGMMKVAATVNIN